MTAASLGFGPIRLDDKITARRSSQSGFRCRTPIPFSQINRRGAAGFDPAMQRHHLLPLQLLGERCFGHLIRGVGRANIGFDDFRSNGMLLPAREDSAIRLCLPLHRGPHRIYNQMVIERVGRIEEAWAARRSIDPSAALDEAVLRLMLLQKALRKRLLDDHRRLVLNKNDPLGAGFDFQELDAMAEELWKTTG